MGVISMAELGRARVSKTPFSCQGEHKALPLGWNNDYWYELLIGMNYILFFPWYITKQFDDKPPVDLQG